jgi:Fe-S cluster assembly scaffold protein SufB
LDNHPKNQTTSFLSAERFKVNHSATFERMQLVYQRALPNESGSLETLFDSTTLIWYVTHDTTVAFTQQIFDESVKRFIIIVEQGIRFEWYDRRYDANSLVTVHGTHIDLVLFEDALCLYTQAVDEPTVAIEQTLRVFVGSNADYTMRPLFAGQSSIRSTMLLYMLGSGARATIRGTYIGSANQIIVLETKQYHLSAHATSSIVLKGIATENASIAYDGLIYIAPGASQTEASLENGTLALSPTCILRSIPTLEILNNDVHCAHASAIGQIDENLLFYLRSRGLSLSQARTLLIMSYSVQDDFFKENIFKKINALSFL